MGFRMGGWGDGEMGRWGDWETGRFNYSLSTVHETSLLTRYNNLGFAENAIADAVAAYYFLHDTIGGN